MALKGKFMPSRIFCLKKIDDLLLKFIKRLSIKIGGNFKKNENCKVKIQNIHKKTFL